MRKRIFHPETWVSMVPNGLGEVKPNHYLEVLKTLRENGDNLGYAIRILRNGVCDGCALGTTGLHDFTMKGIHLCTVRLNLLRLNTMGAMDESLLADVEQLEGLSSKELRDLGRLPYPMVRGAEERGFRRVTWDEALDLVAQRFRATDPERVSFYVTSRGITNEVYYVAQKVARFLGTNNVDNSSRLCHAPSTTGLKQTLGVAATTCSYKDWIGSDLIVFFGSDVPNTQPVTTKYLYYAKTQGTKIAVVNPHREPGLERYWVPSVAESALFGTKLMDEFFPIHSGGDIAFINGVVKHLIAEGWVDRDFIREHTQGFEALEAELAKQEWEDLERYSGSTREDMRRFAEMYGRARTAVLVWSMGITQHRFGVDNVKAIVNLGLARGIVGRDKCGLMPIRGHSGVQGGAEMGCVPNALPGGTLDEANAKRVSDLWGFPVSPKAGLNSTEAITAARRGDIDLLYCIGGNFLETLPEPTMVHEALANVPFRVHEDIVVTKQMFVEPRDTVVLLPAQTRYEQVGGGTETSTERRIYFSPEIPGPRVGEARSEWEILMELAERVRPETCHLIHFDSGEAIRREIARAAPAYAGIENLREKGDAIQWGGEMLCRGGVFPTADGRGHFTPVRPPEVSIPEGMFLLSTRRGKQFNSMVHYDRDPLTGARRESVLMAAEDAQLLGVSDGDPVVLTSDVGQFRGKVKVVPLKARNVQVHWPEGSVLLKAGVCDPACGIPDYHTLVRVAPVGRGGP